MRAWRVHKLGEPTDALRLDDLEAPTARAGQVVIDVEATAVSFPDVLLCRGEYQRKPTLPFIPGGEVAGRVLSVGDGATVRVGERVAALPFGGFADRVVAHQRAVFSLEETTLDWSPAAAFLATYQTGFAALHLRAGVRPGDTVLVHAAAGGVGSAVVQLATAAGVRVFATAGTEGKLAVCTANGAEAAFNNRHDDLVERVLDATGGRGVDVVIDPVGGELFSTSLRCLGFEGRIVTVGFSSGVRPECPVNRVLIKNISVIGLHWGLYATNAPEVVGEVHRRLLELVDLGAIRPLVFGEYEMDDVPTLLEKVAAGEIWGRAVVRPKGVRP